MPKYNSDIPVPINMPASFTSNINLQAGKQKQDNVLNSIRSAKWKIFYLKTTDNN